MLSIFLCWCHGWFRLVVGNWLMKTLILFIFYVDGQFTAVTEIIIIIILLRDKIFPGTLFYLYKHIFFWNYWMYASLFMSDYNIQLHLITLITLKSLSTKSIFVVQRWHRTTSEMTLIYLHDICNCINNATILFC